MKYGFIGLGNMATAILSGMKKSGKFDADTIYGYDPMKEKCDQLSAELGLVPLASEADIARDADVVVLAVKPQMMSGVLDKIAASIGTGKLVITIAAGKPIDFYKTKLGDAPIVRIMPNINAKVNCAVSAMCGSNSATDAQKTIARDIFETVGSVYEIAESAFSSFSALGGASGAFVLVMLDAMASAGVKAGLPRQLSYDVACQVVLGSAKLAATSEEHPIALVDQICSPGGTTIEGVHMIKKMGFESAIHEGINAIIEKDRKLGE